MTSPALVLAILVGTGEAGTPLVTAASSAAAEVVGSEAAVRVVEVQRPSDEEVLRVERALAVPVAVQLTWRDADRLSARVRLHASRTDRWIEREIVFVADDRPTERGRTLGFALASMLPEADPEIQLVPTRADAPPSPAPVEEAPGRRIVEGAFLAGAGLGGPASGLGASLRVEVFVDENTSIGVSAAGRRGSITALDADELTTSIGLGAAWWPLPATASRRLGLALRAEALLLYHAVSHERTSGTEWKGHALPGASFQLEGVWRLSHHLEAVVGAGAEIAFGTLDVIVTPAPADTGAATIPALRAVGRGGLRLRF